uniref:Uncharacterized protein n=1 Tax=Ectopseudomonas oleovorans TaxID=301 RepID=A0A653B0T5_ECTOL
MIYSNAAAAYCFRDLRVVSQPSQFKELRLCIYSGSNRPTPIS